MAIANRVTSDFTVAHTTLDIAHALLRRVHRALARLGHTMQIRRGAGFGAIAGAAANYEYGGNAH